MDRKEFTDLFYEITPDPSSIERWSEKDRLQNWFDMVLPDNTLLSMVNDWLTKGIRTYVDSRCEKRMLSMEDHGPFEEVYAAYTISKNLAEEPVKLYWFFGLNEDSSECMIGKLNGNKVKEYELEDLFEGFMNCCENYGSKCS